MSQIYTRRGIERASTSMTAVALALTLGLFLHSRDAAAAPQCAPHDKLIELLHAGFSEARKAFAFTGNGALVELLANRDGTTWTIVVTQPGQPSCVIMAGQDWFDVSPVDEGQVAQAPQ